MSHDFTKAELQEFVAEFHRAHKKGVYTLRQWKAFIEEKTYEAWLADMDALERQGLVRLIHDGKEWRYESIEWESSHVLIPVLRQKRG